MNMSMNMNNLKQSQSVIIRVPRIVNRVLPPSAMSKKTTGLVVALSSLLLLVVIMLVEK